MNPFVIAFRRIIYSIPLKRLLVGLAVFSVLLASFSSADNVSSLITYIDTATKTVNSNSFATVLDFGSSNVDGTYCIYLKTLNGTLYFGEDQSNNYLNNDFAFKIYSDWVGNYICLYNKGKRYIFFNNQTNSSVTVSYDVFLLNDLLATSLPEMSSLECQTEYNLIPISSVDQNYCTTNNLCPTYDCPSNPIGTGSLSNLYINNILHIGAPNIIMNIPEEIDWDYAYTMGGNTMNIDIVGYNQNYEEIEDWIYTNNYKPSSDDFTNIFTNFSNFGGLLIATLFVILVFYFVKKMFK